MSSIKNSIILGAAVLVAKVSAHGWVTGVTADGQYYPGQSHWSTTPSAGWKANNGDNGFARSLTDDSIICHNDAVPGTQYITIAAGNNMELQWSEWPESHHGPMLDYLAPCGDDCTSVDPSSLQFTKIAEAGLVDSASQHWASDDMIANNNSWVTTIPASIAPGKYVLRHETIALHSAGSANGAQAYPQCLNIEVTGSGSNSLASGTVGTKLYTAQDPGLLINIYQTLKDYVIPGPKVMAGGSAGGNGGSSPAPSKSQAASSVVASSSAAASTSKANASTTSAAVSVTAKPTSAQGNVSTSSASSAAAITATAGARKFVCYEEL